MIQFNLLPDVKMQYIKAKNVKRTVMVVSAIVAASSLAIFIMMFLAVNVFQKTHMNNLAADIKTDSETLKNTPELNKVLTVQNQLNSLPDLHGKKPVVSRLFEYIKQTTPNQVNIGDIVVDFDAKTFVVKGTTDALSTVNKFTDTLKFTKYKYTADNQEKTGKAFTGVVLSSFSKNEKATTYEVKLSYDEVIFNSAYAVTLEVPKITTTRSETEKPTDLFQALPVNPKEVQ